MWVFFMNKVFSWKIPIYSHSSVTTKLSLVMTKLLGYGVDMFMIITLLSVLNGLFRYITK